MLHNGVGPAPFRIQRSTMASTKATKDYLFLCIWIAISSLALYGVSSFLHPAVAPYPIWLRPTATIAYFLSVVLAPWHVGDRVNGAIAPYSRVTVSAFFIVYLSLVSLLGMLYYYLSPLPDAHDLCQDFLSFFTRNRSAGLSL